MDPKMNLDSSSGTFEELVITLYWLVFSVTIVFIFYHCYLIFCLYKKWRRQKWFRKFEKYVGDGNNDEIFELLNKVSISNKSDKWNNNLLHIASKIDNPIIVEHLIKAGCDVNHKNNKGNPPLAYAIEYNSIETAEILLREGSVYDEDDFAFDQGPLHIAVKRENFDMVKLLLKAGSNVNANSRNARGFTPLCAAVFSCSRQKHLEDNYKIIKFLIDSGANVNKTSSRGTTCLNIAIEMIPDHSLLLQLLLENGASVEINECGLNIIQFSLTRIQRWIYDTIDVPDSIHDPSRIPDHIRDEYYKMIPSVLKCVELLLKYGADINFRTKEGQTSLGWVLANANFEEYVDFLLCNGANIDFDDPNVLATVNWYRYGKESAFLLIKYTAMFQAQQKEGRILNFDLTKCNEEVRDYYARCRKELQFMKVSVIPNYPSFFEIITSKMTKRYTLNESFRDAFNKKIKEYEFPIYNDKLSQQFAHDKMKQDLIREAENSLGYILLLDVYEISVVVDNILKYMTQKDLEVLNLI